MYTIRRWLYKPRKDDNSILAQFFYADEDLNYVASELDSFDGRKDPERCTHLVNQLRHCQDKVLNICNQIMDDTISDLRANRDFRAKFPDDVLQENLAGQLWFGAECLAAGSSIMNREVESASMRPLAKALTKTLDNVRTLLRDQCLRNPNCYSDKIKDSLRLFDRLFAEFELCYVSAMVPVKTMREYDMQQNVIVLFSETLQRALKTRYITQEMVDDYDPALMFTIPRLAIVWGLLIYPDGPFNVDNDPNDMSEMFRPFQNLLLKIRELLWTLNKSELYCLEKSLCSVEDPTTFKKKNPDQESAATLSESTNECDSSCTSMLPNVDDYVGKICVDFPTCKQLIQNFYDNKFNEEDEVTSEHSSDDVTEILASPEPGEDLAALQENLSTALNKVIDRSDTRDSGLHSDTCSTSSCDHIKNEDLINKTEVNGKVYISTSVLKQLKQQSHRNPGTSSCYSSPKKSLYKGKSRGCSEPCSPSGRQSLRTRSSSNKNWLLCDLEDCLTSCSSHRSVVSDWDAESCSSDTSSYNSDCQDDEEIALAIQAAEIATRNRLRGRFCGTEDLIHRLFVCISGVADQLQTNYASDLRNILKCVFQMNCSEPVVSPKSSSSNGDVDGRSLRAERISVDSAEEAIERYCFSNATEECPVWIPDELAPQCMSCQAVFTVVRRRHHCRNCGKVFCSRCSSNSVPLPQYGHTKPVRVCNRCFIYQVTPFFIQDDD